jgi:ABC-type multidrug transport system ATPase subunit
MSVLELHSVSKVYGQGVAEVHALSAISLTVDAGVMVAVMGASGSGKSTLLTIAGSLDDPTSGDVIVAGSHVSTLSRNAKAKLRRRSIGCVDLTDPTDPTGSGARADPGEWLSHRPASSDRWRVSAGSTRTLR